tara:strand:+ start:2398 stop:2643 length:246 start_codon:yes stop_codon:yes gene_type:complete
LVSGKLVVKNYVKIGVLMSEDIYDVVINMDIMLGVPSKNQEEAYDKVENFTTEQLLQLALEQLPFQEMNGVGLVRGKATIN